MRVFLGGLIAGVILSIVPGEHSLIAYLVAGVLTTLLMLQLGPRSIVEKVGAAMTACLIAWVAGPRAAYGQSLFAHLFGWLAASTALAFYLHPKSE